MIPAIHGVGLHPRELPDPQFCGSPRKRGITPFWSTCPHRMACVGCSFNLPKASARAMAVEAMTSVTRLLEEVPLSPDERAAAEGDMTALDGMLAKLRDAPALDGRTPQEIYSAKHCQA
jgi:hypothetical protein